MSTSRKDSPATPAERRPMTRREKIVADAIEEAMRPYLGVLPEEGLATMRDILEEAMATHPVALDALAKMEADPATDRSHTRVKGDGGTEGGA
jgi:hypothetical protein